MKIHNLYPAKGSKHRKKIVGRGVGSAHGGHGSTRGGKGQTARSGDANVMPGFAGGQMSLSRRVPKRGFSNANNKVIYSIVNVETLEKKFDINSKITPELLVSSGIVRKKTLPVKILGDGALTKKFDVTANAFSKSAVTKIQAAGGTATVQKR